MNNDKRKAHNSKRKVLIRSEIKTTATKNKTGVYRYSYE